MSDLPGVEQFEKVDPALAWCAGKPAKQFIADLRDVAIPTLVARTAVIDCNVATHFQPRDQHRVLFIMEGLFVGTEQRINLTCRNIGILFTQLLQQQRLSDLAVMVLIQNIREQHYIRRPPDLLRMWHVKIEAWILEQAGIQFDAKAEPGALRVVAK